jgi:predicted GTPase
VGYGPEQVADLAATLNDVDADIVLAATPVDLARVMQLNKPVVRVLYELDQITGVPLVELLRRIAARAVRTERRPDVPVTPARTAQGRSASLART